MISGSINRIAALAVVTFGVVFAGCKTRQDSSRTESVDIPQTTVKNKMKIGFCWAYATTDFWESEYKKKSGESLNISEEALGFYRISEQLMEIVKKKADPAKIIEELACQRFQGLHILKVRDTQRAGGFELAETYGVIPEEVYSVKFMTEEQRSDTFWGIKERMKLLVASKAPSEITVEDLEKRVIVRPEGSPTRASSYKAVPPSTFEYMGKTWTPKSFYSEKLAANSSDFVKFEFDSEADLPKMVELIKRTLASGTSVPFGFGVDRNHLFKVGTATIFSGKKTVSGPNPAKDPYLAGPDHLKEPGCPPKVMTEYAQGKHAVLITDFVNLGSSEGAFENQEKLNNEVAKPADQLDYVKIKNNWGIDEEGDEEGSSWLASTDGYYRVDREYLLGSLRNGVSMNITVPKAIADAL